MKFAARTAEIAHLHEIAQRSTKTAQFTIVTGRRRIGKTALLLRAFEQTNMLYFFVARKAEQELCREFTEEMVAKLGVTPLGAATRFADIFAFIMEYAHQQPVTLVIDEFQDFLRVNASVFSDMQRIWDLKKDGAKINLIVCGSVNTLMNKLFRDHKEPLYGRQTEFLKVEPFTPTEIKEILRSYHADARSEDLLALYLLTGGVPKYVELLIDSEAFTAGEMLERVVAKNSPFIDEGKTLLIEEMGRDYGRYFEILTLIATGHSSRSDIENIMHAEVGGYLTRLERDYELIGKHRPLLQKAPNKNNRYVVSDLFLRFWFRFIYKYNYMLEANAFGKLLDIVRRDYNTYSGVVLGRYFTDVLRASGQFTHLGSWWDRNGEHEIDIIGIDDVANQITFYEVKRRSSEINLSDLRRKTERLFGGQ